MSEVIKTVKPNLVHDIPAELVTRMKAHLVPVFFKKDSIAEAMDVSGIDTVKDAYTQCDKAHLESIGRLPKLFATPIISFHLWGYYGLFKPTLYEVYCAIYLAFGDNWNFYKYFWLDCENMGPEAILGNYHFCRCLLWAEEERVLE